MDSPALPATIRPRYISWFAYAIEESASGEKVASARNLFNLSEAVDCVGSGGPRIKSLNLLISLSLWMRIHYYFMPFSGIGSISSPSTYRLALFSFLLLE
jgi:hypothetical protein